MTIQRMDHVGIVVDDLAAATAFFVELGLELEGEATLESPTVDRINGLTVKPVADLVEEVEMESSGGSLGAAIVRVASRFDDNVVEDAARAVGFAADRG
mgnify:CR=1 FL=1